MANFELETPVLMHLVPKFSTLFIQNHISFFCLTSFCLFKFLQLIVLLLQLINSSLSTDILDVIFTLIGLGSPCLHACALVTAAATTLNYCMVVHGSFAFLALGMFPIIKSNRIFHPHSLRHYWCKIEYLFLSWQWELFFWCSIHCHYVVHFSSKMMTANAHTSKKL